MSILVASGPIGFCLVKKFTSRPKYSTHRIIEHERNRAFLINECGAQPVSFTSFDGLQLSGLFVVRSQAQRAIVVCHGYRMCKERMRAFVEMFPNDTLLLFDFRGHGQSEGSTISFGYHEKYDVLAAAQWLQNQDAVRSLPLYGIGTSMGAVSLLTAAVEDPVFKALILDSLFVSLEEQSHALVGKRFKLPKYPFRMVSRYLFEYYMQFSMRALDVSRYMHKLTTPTMVVHSKCDDIVPWQKVNNLCSVCPMVQQLWLVDSSNHSRLFDDCFDEYCAQVCEFLKTVDSTKIIH